MLVMLVYILQQIQHNTQKYAVQNRNGIKIQKTITIFIHCLKHGGKKNTQHKISVPI